MAACMWAGMAAESVTTGLEDLLVTHVFSVGSTRFREQLRRNWPITSTTSPNICGISLVPDV
jgi:hypothetical protein